MNGIELLQFIEELVTYETHHYRYKGYAHMIPFIKDYLIAKGKEVDK